jgi:4-hydroxy-2-oxoheptanedioate aldolase
MPSEAMVEMSGMVGMDFVVIDTEHGPGDQIPLTAHLTAAAAAGIPALVRIGNVSEILRVLDLGAAGIIAPHISTVEQAQAVVRAASYPPRGERGFATYTRSGRHGLIGAAEHLENARDRTAIILMIEDAAGVRAAEQIASVDGVDALFVGPADLAVAMGFPGHHQGSPAVVAAIAEAQDAARRAGVAVVSITADPATAREHFAGGSTMVLYNVLAALGGLFTSLAGGRGESSNPARGERSAVAPPMVFLPGMLGTAQLWDDVLAELADPIRAVTGRIDLDDSVGGMAESVLSAAPESFDLVGHSLGGVVALEIARRAPHRVGRMALVNVSGRGPSAEQSDAWSELATRTLGGDFDQLVTEQAEENLGPAGTPLLRKRWQAAAHQIGPDAFLRQLTAQSARPDSLPTLATLALPVLVVSGELDRVCPPELQRELAQGIPGSRHVTLPGAGHMSPLDSAPELARVLREFLTG